MGATESKVSDSLRAVTVRDLSVDVLPDLADRLEISEGNRTTKNIEARLNELADNIDQLIDTSTSASLAEALTLIQKAKGILDVIGGNTKPWEQIALSRDADNNFKLNFDNAQIDTEVLQQAFRDKGRRLYISDTFKTALSQGLKGELVIVSDAGSKTQDDTGRILEENGLSSSDEPKAELLTTMLVYYVKDFSGLELSSDERELLNLFDNRNRDISEFTLVRCGSSSFGVFVGHEGFVSARGWYGDCHGYGFAAGRPLSE